MAKKKSSGPGKRIIRTIGGFWKSCTGILSANIASGNFSRGIAEKALRPESTPAVSRPGTAGSRWGSATVVGAVLPSVDMSRILKKRTRYPFSRCPVRGQAGQEGGEEEAGGDRALSRACRGHHDYFFAQDCRGRVAGVPCLPGGEEVIGSGVSSHSACGAVRRPLLLPACDRRACAPARSNFAPGEEARAASAAAGWCARSGTAAPVASPPHSRSWRACAESVGDARELRRCAVRCRTIPSGHGTARRPLRLPPQRARRTRRTRAIAAGSRARSRGSSACRMRT